MTPPALTPIVPVITPPIDTTVKPPVVTSFLGGGTLTQQRPVLRTTIARAAPLDARGPVPASAVTGTGPAAQAQAVPVLRVPAELIQ